MTKRVFCIGNGESRKDFNLWLLKPYGYIYGCNAIYRDYPDLIDVLTAVDNGIIHEIYHSGFALRKPCYFRNWTKVPAMMYESVVNGLCTQEELNELKGYDVVRENERGDSKEFVIHGSSLKGVVNILKKTKKDYPRATRDIVETKIKHATISISWIKENDKSNDVKDCWSDYKDHGWACGATSGYIATKLEKPDEIYLIGHDLRSDTGRINNLYKSTKNYATAEGSATPHVNWVNQWYTLMDWNPKIKFFKVNKELDKENTNKEIDEWKKWKERGQLHYITQAQLLDKLQKN